jgi:alpha-D-xyloside xylohydrolase
MKEAIQYLNTPIDIVEDFFGTQNNYFFLTELESFDPPTGRGLVRCKRFRRKLRLSFNQEMIPFEEALGWEFPPDYQNDKTIEIAFDFFMNDAVRIRLDSHTGGITKNHHVPLIIENEEKLIPLGEVAQVDRTQNSWSLVSDDREKIVYGAKKGMLRIYKNPFKFELTDRIGKSIWKSYSILEKTSLLNSEPLPCCFIQKAGTTERYFSFSYTLAENERFYGCGESFTSLNKRGQRINLCTVDPKGVENPHMYKPIPFYISSRGYGIFMYHSCPMSFDFGATYGGAQSLFVGEDCFDMFLFLGSPKEILSQYTDLTGRSPLPPPWSFGLWMGRITYNSEQEIMETAQKLRSHRIPCDVIHLDTGWFSQDWRCDFVFDPRRFPDPGGMIKTLHKEGFHLSLWQLPYITPQNRLFKKAIENGFAVTSGNGDIPTEDAIYDFSNPAAVQWYQSMLETILDLGVDVIKADFGEAAPYHGMYASGKSGWFEHNLYPLRYNKTVAEITRKVKGYTLIWGRSAWAGSQRYPLHWGGDAESTNSGMAATLRGGLSFGLSGFPFWSHDLGGFVKTPSPDLYLRWTAFGMFCSHARCHGNPPREPWDFSENFIDEFRKLVEWRYSLMPHILLQAEKCSRTGYPMIRPLFFEFPQDQGAWFPEDEFLFGDDILVAPIFEDEEKSRNVYLPAGSNWIDYHSRTCFEGGTWYRLSTSHYIIVLVRDGAVIPVTEPKESVEKIDWMACHFRVYRKDNSLLSGILPDLSVKFEKSPGKPKIGIKTLNLPIADLGREYILSADSLELIRV